MSFSLFPTSHEWHCQIVEFVPHMDCNNHGFRYYSIRYGSNEMPSHLYVFNRGLDDRASGNSTGAFDEADAGNAANHDGVEMECLGAALSALDTKPSSTADVL
jgi:hypothetical protein